MASVTGRIKNNRVTVEMGDITQSCAEAIVVPQFTNCSSYGGVGGSVARSGARVGMQTYDAFISEQGEQKYGSVLLTPAGGGGSDYLLHVASLGSGADSEFNTIKTSMFNVLKVAEENGVDSIAAPALGTGIVGSLTGKQSAEAMMSAIKEYADKGGKPINIRFVIYGDKNAFDRFSDALKSDSFSFANEKQLGKKPFNMASWVTGMARDANANKKKFGSENGPDNFLGGPS